ncbi:MAG: YlbF family regulator [Leptospira sp.]|nr:YlbF family regulator [Leptospira sp.]
MAGNELEIIAKRRHPKLAKKHAIYELILDSYKGGQDYINKSYLPQYPRERESDYKARKARSVYFNDVQPIADTMAGMLYETPVQRDKLEGKYAEFTSNISKGKGVDSFMRTLAIHSLLRTVFVLVDSPSFDSSQVVTEKDRIDKKLSPYAVIYFPEQIRDFSLDDKGELRWILLDDSYLDNENPLSEAAKKTQYTLWTSSEFKKFIISDDGKVSVQEEGTHKVGAVPGFLCSWRDLEDDGIADTPFEDISILGKKIYETISYMDETIASGTFQILFYPGEPPKEASSKGIGNLSIVPFDPASSKGPYFDGPGLRELFPFIQGLEVYLKKALSIMGLDKDQEKSNSQSGTAKKLEYRKAYAILNQGASVLEEAEKKIFSLFAKWQGDQTPPEYKVSYNRDFDPESLDIQVKRLISVYDTIIIPSIRKRITLELLPKLFPNLDAKEMKALESQVLSEIDVGQQVSDLLSRMATRDEPTNNNTPAGDTTQTSAT